MSDYFLSKSALKQRDALLPELFDFAADYAIEKVQTSHVRLKLNGKQQHILGVNIDTINKNTETVISVGKDVGLEVNPEETKNSFTFICHDQSADQNNNMKIVMWHRSNIW